MIWGNQYSRELKSRGKMCKVDNKELTREDQLDLEAYRTINSDIRGDADVGMLFERLLIPLIVAAPILSVRYPETHKLTNIGGIVLTIFLLLRTIRSESRVKIRFNLLRGIEKKLGFRAHTQINENIKGSWRKFFRDYHIKLVFCLIMLAYYFSSLFGFTIH